MGSHLTATGRHLPYGITRCYLLPDTSERASVQQEQVYICRVATSGPIVRCRGHWMAA